MLNGLYNEVLWQILASTQWWLTLYTLHSWGELMSGKKSLHEFELERTPTWPPPQIYWSWWWFEAPQVVPAPYTCLNLYKLFIFAHLQELSVFSCRYCLGVVGRRAWNPNPCSSLGCRFPPGHGNSSSPYNCGSFEPLNLAEPPILCTYMFTPAMDYSRVLHRQNLRKKASARRTQLVLKSPPDKVTWRKTNCSVGGLRE